MKSWKQERLRRKKLLRYIKFQRMMRKIFIADFKRRIIENILNGTKYIKINKGNNDD